MLPTPYNNHWPRSYIFLLKQIIDTRRRWSAKLMNGKSESDLYVYQDKGPNAVPVSTTGPDYCVICSAHLMRITAHISVEKILPLAFRNVIQCSYLWLVSAWLYGVWCKLCFFCCNIFHVTHQCAIFIT